MTFACLMPVVAMLEEIVSVFVLPLQHMHLPARKLESLLNGEPKNYVVCLNSVSIIFLNVFIF